jgi:hypothetical protein
MRHTWLLHVCVHARLHALTPLSLTLPPRSTCSPSQDAQGKTFWYNTQTKATSWTDPTPPKAMPVPAAGAQSPWNRTQDAQGKTFWFNTETKATSWTDPNVSPAHNPWQMSQDAQGRTFWFNPETKATSWTDPNAAPIQIHVQPGQLQMQQVCIQKGVEGRPAVRRVMSKFKNISFGEVSNAALPPPSSPSYFAQNGITDPRALPLGHNPFANVQCPGCQRLVTTQVCVYSCVCMCPIGWFVWCDVCSLWRAVQWAWHQHRLCLHTYSLPPPPIHTHLPPPRAKKGGVDLGQRCLCRVLHLLLCLLAPVLPAAMC